MRTPCHNPAVDIQWHLTLGETLVATIEPDRVDHPWTYGRLVASPAFDHFRRYFTDPDGWEDDDDELDALCDEVTAGGGFELTNLSSGESHHLFSLFHDDDVVWFRF
jgi:hypothetical protein